MKQSSYRTGPKTLAEFLTEKGDEWFFSSPKKNMKVKIKDYEIERTHGYTGQSSKATLVGYCANAGRHITIVIEEDGCFSDNIANLIQDHENIELEIKITGALPSIRKTLA